MTNLGVGIGRLNNWVIMIPFALPTEVIHAKIISNFNNYSKAIIIKIIKASIYRIKPLCPVFGECGGCQYQNLIYEEQLKWKSKHVQEVFNKIASINNKVELTKKSPKKYYYRSKITPHLKHSLDKNKINIGFVSYHNSNDIVDVDNCVVAKKSINIKLKVVRNKFKKQSINKQRIENQQLILRQDLNNIVSKKKIKISELVGDYKFNFLSDNFFQNNSFLLLEFVNYIIKQTISPKVDFLLDAYCGVGLFSISASKHFKKCLGVEINTSSINFAKYNSKINNIKNCEFITNKSENIFKYTKYLSSKTSIIINPPRKGCSLEFINNLINYNPLYIVYVSCDPATQARDLKILIQNKYKIISIQPFDLFPQTRHIENVVSLTNDKYL